MDVSFKNAAPQIVRAVEDLKVKTAYIDKDGDLFIVTTHHEVIYLTQLGDSSFISWTPGEMKGLAPFTPFVGEITLTF